MWSGTTSRFQVAPLQHMRAHRIACWEECVVKRMSSDVGAASMREATPGPAKSRGKERLSGERPEANLGGNLRRTEAKRARRGLGSRQGGEGGGGGGGGQGESWLGAWWKTEQENPLAAVGDVLILQEGNPRATAGGSQPRRLSPSSLVSLSILLRRPSLLFSTRHNDDRPENQGSPLCPRLPHRLLCLC